MSAGSTVPPAFNCAKMEWVAGVGQALDGLPALADDGARASVRHRDADGQPVR